MFDPNQILNSLGNPALRTIGQPDVFPNPSPSQASNLLIYLVLGLIANPCESNVVPTHENTSIIRSL